MAPLLSESHTSLKSKAVAEAYLNGGGAITAIMNNSSGSSSKNNNNADSSLPSHLVAQSCGGNVKAAQPALMPGCTWLMRCLPSPSADCKLMPAVAVFAMNPKAERR